MVTNRKSQLGDFKPLIDAKHIIETGKLGEYNFYPGSLTRLIQEAGRWCKSYASDLFIIWSGIDRRLRQGTLLSETELFGFRESGIDSKSYIFGRYENDPYAHLQYRSIWRLDITVDGENVGFDLYECFR